MLSKKVKEDFSLRSSRYDGKHAVDTTGVSPSPVGPPSCCLLHFLHHICLSVSIFFLRYPVPVVLFFCLFSCYSHQSISDYSWEVYIVHSGVFAGLQDEPTYMRIEPV